jgi:hypothetical protein
VKWIEKACLTGGTLYQRPCYFSTDLQCSSKLFLLLHRLPSAGDWEHKCLMTMSDLRGVGDRCSLATEMATRAHTPPGWAPILNVSSSLYHLRTDRHVILLSLETLSSEYFQCTGSELACWCAESEVREIRLKNHVRCTTTFSWTLRKTLQTLRRSLIFVLEYLNFEIF